jgi:hypothetical protein
MGFQLQHQNLQVEPLQFKHLSQLQRPELEYLAIQLQKLALLRPIVAFKPWLSPKSSPAPLALVALSQKSNIVGLLLAEPCNRRGSCWRLEVLESWGETASRLDVAGSLLKAAMDQAPGAMAWVARAASNAEQTLAALREQGFQILQHQRVWLLNSLSKLEIAAALPEPLLLQPLTRASAVLLLQLELVATPSPLRQLQDLRSEDLLDDSQAESLVLIDPQRHQAVAGARLLRRRHRGPTEIELSLHPGWGHLLGNVLGHLLAAAATKKLPVLVRCDLGNSAGLTWLAQQGAIELQEELVFARSLWRRHEISPNPGLASRTLERLVGQWQPGQRPVPEAMRWR